jgi:starch synthase
MYSLKYGTIPVVRATGGLEETIDEQAFGGGNGFKFWGHDPNELLSALERALGTFRNKDEWTRMMRRGMAQDFSWEKPAHEYVRVYERVIQNRS